MHAHHIHRSSLRTRPNTHNRRVYVMCMRAHDSTYLSDRHFVYSREPVAISCPLSCQLTGHGVVLTCYFCAGFNLFPASSSTANGGLL